LARDEPADAKERRHSCRRPRAAPEAHKLLARRRRSVRPRGKFGALRQAQGLAVRQAQALSEVEREPVETAAHAGGRRQDCRRSLRAPRIRTPLKMREVHWQRRLGSTPFRMARHAPPGEGPLRSLARAEARRSASVQPHSVLQPSATWTTNKCSTPSPLSRRTRIANSTMP
jgi:hypothetical protein